MRSYFQNLLETKGLKIFITNLTHQVAWTINTCFRFFLYLERGKAVQVDAEVLGRVRVRIRVRVRMRVGARLRG